MTYTEICLSLLGPPRKAFSVVARPACRECPAHWEPCIPPLHVPKRNRASSFYALCAYGIGRIRGIVVVSISEDPSYSPIPSECCADALIFAPIARLHASLQSRDHAVA